MADDCYSLTARLRHRIIIEQKVESGRNDSNEKIYTWSKFMQTFAGVEPLQSREFFQSQQVNADITHRIRIRYIAGVTSEMRINYRGKIYSIEAPPINPQMRNVELQLMCKEVIKP